MPRDVSLTIAKFGGTGVVPLKWRVLGEDRHLSTNDWDKLLSRLPDRVCVAFAARCARRVQPIFREDWPSAPESLCKLVERAIQLAERCAAAEIGDAHSTSTFALNARTAAKAARQADAELAAHVASAAAYATYAATAIGYADCSSTHAAEVVEYSLKAAGPQEEAIRAAIQADLDQLQERLEAGDLDADGPIMTGDLGSLWTHGDPVLS